MNYLREILAHTIFYLEPPNRKRTQPMEVLALGLSRSGTESLRAALMELGYPTYHGFDTVIQPEDHVLWHQFKLRKFSGSRFSTAASAPSITRNDFDRIIGNCTAVTDMPAVAFAAELVAAYPEAKVILNYRKDIDKWYDSTVGTFIGWQNAYLARLPTWFKAELFWPEISFISRSTGLFTTFYWGSFLKNGKWIARDHNAMIRGLVPKENLLEWTVQDGWEPLCKFLGKEVPDHDFPSGNERNAFSDRLEQGRDAWQATARRNMFVFATVILILVAIVIKLVL